MNSWFVSKNSIMSVGAGKAVEIAHFDESHRAEVLSLVRRAAIYDTLKAKIKEVEDFESLMEGRIAELLEVQDGKDHENRMV